MKHQGLLNRRMLARASVAAGAGILACVAPGSKSSLASNLPASTEIQSANAPVTLHRLNRTEYANVIRDLFGFEIDATSMLPPDNVAFGFDNISGQLAMNPTLLERYASAARKISSTVVGDYSSGRLIQNLKQDFELSQSDRMGSSFPVGTRGGIRIKKYFSVPGDYILRLRYRGGNPPEPLLVLLDGKLLKPGLMSPMAPMAAYSTLDPWGRTEIPLNVGVGEHEIIVTFVKKTAAIADVGFEVPYSITPFTQLRISDADIEGPINAPREGFAIGDPKIFICTPRRRSEEDRCAKRILAQLAYRAYRGRDSADAVSGLLGFYRSGYANGGFGAGIRLAIERMLVDPRFLYRIEERPRPGAPVDQMALASRLSFFLWSSTPDDELLSLARKGQLKGTSFDRQVRRMLADKRMVQSLVGNFAWQWLDLRRLQDSRPNATIFPEFNADARDAALEETRLFLADQIKRNRPIVELLTADYTFMNEPLAKYLYNVPGVYGSEFRRVNYPDRRRAGLLGHASILTLTSYGNRTTPVIRGKWVMESILGQSVPPPPPNVPGIDDSTTLASSATMREVMEAHRESPVCSACHKVMDPIGFAMENFNGIGIWRTRERGALIDASVSIGGKHLDGASGLYEYLAAEKGQFVNNVAQKAMVFALGRSLTAAEIEEVEKFSQRDPASVTWANLIGMIVGSKSFKSGLMS